MKNLKVLLVTLSLFAFTFLSMNIVQAQAFEVNHIASSIEKISEKISLVLKFSKHAKADHLQYLAEKRLAELIYVIKSDKIDSVEETASRYSTYLGNLTNYIINRKFSDKKDELISLYSQHAQILKEQQKKFKYDSGWWLAIQHTINLTGIYSEQLKRL